MPPAGDTPQAAHVATHPQDPEPATHCGLGAIDEAAEGVCGGGTHCPNTASLLLQKHNRKVLTRGSSDASCYSVNSGPLLQLLSDGAPSPRSALASRENSTAEL